MQCPYYVHRALKELFGLGDDQVAVIQTVTGGGFGSAVDMTAGADVVPADQATVLDWRGVAEVRGPVAAVGGRVLDAQAQKLITQTFAQVREKLST